MTVLPDVSQTALFIRKKLGKHGVPRIAMVLGSGLGDFADSLHDRIVISYRSIPGFPVSTVAGHKGQFVAGRAGGVPVLCLQGRFHAYEGHSPGVLAFPLRVLAAMGVETVLLTNAAGGINPGFAPGDLMLIADHVNLSGVNPLVGHNDDRIGPRFPAMNDAYDTGLRRIFRKAAQDTGILLREGVYFMVSGPSFDTPAEIRAFRGMGADAVGMSTAAECIAAVHAGLRVAGISVIVNMAPGLAPHAPSHQETLDTAARAGDNLQRLVLAALPALVEE